MENVSFMRKFGLWVFHNGPQKQARNINDIIFFTLKETSAFLGEIERELAKETIQLQHKLFFHLALFCGLRRGELIALEWMSDVPIHTIQYI